MSFRFASRLENVGLSMIRQILMKAEGCLNLGIGEPDFFAPEVVRKAARKALDEDKIGYSPTMGLPELRDQVWKYHGSLDGHSVCITNGSQEALFDLIFALVDPGDEVLVPDPGYVAYPTMVGLAGGTAIPYPLRSTHGFELNLEDVARRITPRTQAMIVVSPSNPTGQCLSAEQLEQLAQLSQQKGFLLISDEIYREIYYTPEKPATITEVTDQAVVLSGVSKMASMTGWRIGWACGPDPVMEKMTVMHQYSSISTSTLAQKGAVAAFSAEGREEMAGFRARLAANCDLICSLAENELGRHAPSPCGAIYLMLPVGDLPLDSLAVSLELLKDGVATIPGAAFGKQGEGYLRLSFACDEKRISDGMQRIKLGLARLTPRR